MNYMSFFSTSLISSLFILLFVALVLGEIFERFNFPAIIGELLTGFILGPAVLGLISMNDVFTGLSEISLFFLMLLIGIEVTTETLLENYRLGSLFSLTSFIIPLLAMIFVSYYLLGLTPASAVLVSISVAVPSISIVSVLVKNFKLLQLNAGHVIMASVIITDIIAFGTLSAIMSPDKASYDIVAMISLLVILFAIDYEIRRHSGAVLRVLEALRSMDRGEKMIFGAIIVSGLVISVILEQIGITFVLGAFFAGILISEVVVGEKLHEALTSTLTRLNDSFFIPIFFSIAGLEIIIPGANSLLRLVVLMGLSAGIGAPLNYLASRKYVKELREKTMTGILGSRGSVGIIIASVAFTGGYIDGSLYSLCVFATLIFSLIFTPLVRRKDISLPSENGEKKVAGTE